jgi:hypothetical protein
VLTLADVTVPDGLQRAPRIDRAEVRLLWYCDFWDGPRSGMLVYRGEECWFEVVAENEGDLIGWYRRFAVLRLSHEQHAEEVRWHELFRRCVGRHTDFNASGRETLGTMEPKERHAEFYDAYSQRTPPDFSSNEVLGWFEM